MTSHPIYDIDILPIWERVHKSQKVAMHLAQSSSEPVCDIETLRTAAIDFLADFQHFCDVSGMNFEKVLTTSRMHFAVETGRDTS